jgi:hypothetical protein
VRVDSVLVGRGPTRFLGVTPVLPHHLPPTG